MQAAAIGLNLAEIDNSKISTNKLYQLSMRDNWPCINQSYSFVKKTNKNSLIFYLILNSTAINYFMRGYL